MPELRFELGFKSEEFRSMDLPVEVRRPNSSLVQRALTSEIVEVPEGEYLIYSRLPAGQEIFSSVSVGPAGAVAVVAPQPEDESPHDSHEVQRFLRRSMPDYEPEKFAASPGTEFRWIGSGGWESYLPDSPRRDASVNLLRGASPLGAARVPLSVEGVETIEDGIQFRWNATVYTEPCFVELLQSHRPPCITALPAYPGVAALVIVRRGGSAFTAEVHLGNAEADLLVSALCPGSLQAAASAIQSKRARRTAEDLLYGKLADPYSAVAGAYALLHVGDLDRLHHWTANLKNWYEWLPDAAVIRAEHLARLGEHAAAAKALLDIRNGVPQFTAGLSYALNRLAVYLQLRVPIWNTEAEAGRAREIQSRLQQICSAVDFTQPLLTLRNLRLDAEYPEGTVLNAWFA